MGHCQQHKLCGAFVALLEGGKYRLTFGGTEIVARVHVVHPLRQVFALPNKLVQSLAAMGDGHSWFESDKYMFPGFHLISSRIPMLQ